MSEQSPPPVPPPVPQPRYGEYAPGYVPPVSDTPAPAAPPQPYGAASYPQQQPAGRTRKTWDLVLTVILLVMGFFGMLAGVGYGVLFSSPELLDEGFRQQGLGGFDGEVGSAPAVLIISHVVLYLLALGGSIALLAAKRVAFWVPLVAGVIAAIVFWGALIAVMMTDPGFVAQYS